MEPLSALGLAVNVLQLLECGIKIANKCADISKSASGALPENKRLEDLAQHLRSQNDILKQSLSTETSTTDEIVNELATECNATADELVRLLEKLKLEESGRSGKWNAFRTVLRSEKERGKLNKLQSTMLQHRKAIDSQIIQQLRIDSKVANAEHSSQIQALHELLKVIESRTFSDEETASGARQIASETAQQAQVLQEIRDMVKEILTAQNEAKRSNVESELQISEVRRKIRNTLYFSEIDKRFDEIEEAHRETFKWILVPDGTRPWHDFVKWLREGSDTYWLSGKPGSGKSTLMAFLSTHEELFKHLREWASPQRLVVAAFYFWGLGTGLQRSERGLLRTLLFRILDQVPELTEAAVDSNEDRLRLYEMQLDSDYYWTEKKLMAALQRVLSTEMPVRFMLFVDGLDELDGDTKRLAEFLSKIAKTDKTKVCAASRPWVCFERVFGSSYMLRLQDLSRPDIERYVDCEFAQKPHMQMLSLESPLIFHRLIRSLVDKASGIFLWVKLVIRSLTNSMDNGDSLAELESRLLEFPSELRELFQFIYDLIKKNKVYYEQAIRIFTTLLLSPDRSSYRRPLIFDFDFVVDYLEKRLSNSLDGNLTMELLYNVLKDFDYHLKSRCLGLVEIKIYDVHDIIMDMTIDLEIDQIRQASDLLNPPYRSRCVSVQFAHRSVSEFLSSDECERDIQMALKNRAYNPFASVTSGLMFPCSISSSCPVFLSSLCTTYHCYQYRLRELGDSLRMATHADFIGSIAKLKRFEQALSNFNVVSKARYSRLDDTDEELRKAEHKGLLQLLYMNATHNISDILLRDRSGGFLTVAALWGLVDYFENVNSRTSDEASIRKEFCDRLLHFLVSYLTDMSESISHKQRSLISITRLLERQYSPNIRIRTPNGNEETAWQVLLSCLLWSFGLPDISEFGEMRYTNSRTMKLAITAFIEHGAHLNEVIRHRGDMGANFEITACGIIRTGVLIEDHIRRSFDEEFEFILLPGPSWGSIYEKLVEGRGQEVWRRYCATDTEPHQTNHEAQEDELWYPVSDNSPYMLEFAHRVGLRGHGSMGDIAPATEWKTLSLATDEPITAQSLRKALFLQEHPHMAQFYPDI